MVARFGLFLREIEFTQHQLSLHSGKFTLWAGTAMILLGVIVNVFSALQHIRFVSAVKRGTEVVDRPVTMAVAIALILAVTGVAMTIYLVFVR